MGGRPYGISLYAVLPCCCRCQIESMDDDQSRERPARISWRRLVLPRGWSTASRTEGGIGGKRRVPSFPSLPFPCLALPGLPALSWLGFDLERRKEQGGRGWAVGALCILRGAMQCNLRMDGLAVYRMVAGVACCSDTFWWATGRHTHTNKRNGGHTRARWEEEEEGASRSSKACRRGRKA